MDLGLDARDDEQSPISALLGKQGFAVRDRCERPLGWVVSATTVAPGCEIPLTLGIQAQGPRTVRAHDIRMPQ